MSVKLTCVIFFVIISFFLFSTERAQAVEDPFSSFNNKFGVHILFTSELESAAKLVNSNGGDWGYVIIPIQSGDKSAAKWQKFMDDSKKNHIIPILRLATEADPSNPKVWRKPTEYDLIDFGNFLNSLDWPVKNRYIVVFNEVNRGDEWGGNLNADEYAHMLSYAVDVFKAKSPDFFMINAGLDNAAPKAPPQFENEYDFLRQMHSSIPGIFNKLDGFASHSYPNPAFSQPPWSLSKTGISSFVYERELVKAMSGKTLPVLITETGWSGNALSDAQRADYFKNAFKTAWSDIGIVAVTPFLLSTNGSFTEFSLINDDGSPTLQYIALKSLPKVRGMPALVKKPPILLPQQKKVLGYHTMLRNVDLAEASGNQNSSDKNSEEKKNLLSDLFKKAIFWIVDR